MRRVRARAKRGYWTRMYRAAYGAAALIRPSGTFSPQVGEKEHAHFLSPSILR